MATLSAEQVLLQGEQWAAHLLVDHVTHMSCIHSVESHHMPHYKSACVCTASALPAVAAAAPGHENVVQTHASHAHQVQHPVTDANMGLTGKRSCPALMAQAERSGSSPQCYKGFTVQ